jgi:glutathione S-transferase
MFFEQYSHEPYIAVARRWLAFESKEALDEKRALVPEWHARGNAALAVMESHLARHDWFAGRRYSLADIALYGYTHCADEGGFELSRYKSVSAWVDGSPHSPIICGSTETGDSDDRNWKRVLLHLLDVSRCRLRSRGGAHAR